MVLGKLDFCQLCCLVLLVLAPGAGLATPPVEVTPETDSGIPYHSPTALSLEIAGGYVHHSWEPGLDNNFVGFQTEGLQAWWAAAGVRLGDMPLFSFRIDRPFHSTPQQEEMVQAARHDETGYEELVGILDFLPLTSRFMKEKPGLAGVIRALLSFRLIYSRNLFFGHTSSETDFAYFPMTATVDRNENPPIAYGYENYSAGQPLNFKTEFRDFHIMIPVLNRTGDRNRKNVFRVGYFHSRWEKPSESVFATLEGDPIIQDTRLDTDGFSFSYESGLFEPGFGWRADLDWGILGSELTSAVDNEDFLRDDEGILYVGLSGEGRYSFRLIPDSDVLWATIGARGQFRYWKVWRATRDSEGNVIENKPVKDIDKDKLYQVFAMVRIRI